MKDPFALEDNSLLSNLGYTKNNSFTNNNNHNQNPMGGNQSSFIKQGFMAKNYMNNQN
jgi:hypothetical protein